MNGFSRGASGALACAAIVVAVAVAPGPGEAAGGFHRCGDLTAGRFALPALGVRGAGCRRARALVRGWLAGSTSLAGEGLPRSERRGHWHCLQTIAWACVRNGGDPRIVFELDLRRHADLWTAIEAAYATGPAGEPYVAYAISVRNLGRDAVRARLVTRLPSGVTFVNADSSRGGCGAPDGSGRLACALGRIGGDEAVAVRVTGAYDCATPEPIGPTPVAVRSRSGDVDPSNNRAALGELERLCPVVDPWPDPIPDPLPDEDEAWF